MNQSKDCDTYTVSIHHIRSLGNQENCCDMAMLHKLVTRTFTQPEIHSFSGPHFLETTWTHPTKARDATNPHLTTGTKNGTWAPVHSINVLNTNRNPGGMLLNQSITNL